MLGFVRTDNESIVSCLGDPQRAVAAFHELLRRGKDAAGAIRAGLHHQNPAVREGCCRLLDHLVDTDSMGQLIAMADDPDARVRIAAFHALACDRCKGGTCAPGAERGPRTRVAAPGLRPGRTRPREGRRTSSASSSIPMAAPSPPWRRPAPKTRARSSGRRQAGLPPAAPSTSGPSHARPGNGTALNQTTREWTPRRALRRGALCRVHMTWGSSELITLWLRRMSARPGRQRPGRGRPAPRRCRGSTSTATARG